MVKINKSELPDNIKITCDNDYRDGPVFDILYDDCNKKCYLCEDKDLIPPIVEHIVPHRGDNCKKFDWDNLLIACHRCNNIKGMVYANILNPLKVDPELYISLDLGLGCVFVSGVPFSDCSGEVDQEVVDLTVKLLNLIYNNNTTGQQKMASFNLRKKISDELAHFTLHVAGYKDEPGLYAEDISNDIDKSSIFAAFKRKIARDDCKLHKDFEYKLKFV
jgi:hypothetical protein